MSALEPFLYLTDKSLAASFVGKPIATALLDRVSFTAEWTAFAATDGDLYVEVTDDPRWEVDAIRGTSTAKWTKRSFAAGSYDGTNITVSGAAMTLNASAGQANIDLADLPNGAVRLGYTRRAGGTTSQLQTYASGSGGTR